MPVVRDLRAAVADSSVVLTWTMPAPAVAVAGFNLYRSGPQSESETCPACPRHYVLMRKVTAESSAGSFRAVVQKGAVSGRFFYRVIPYDRDGHSGPESNEAEIMIQ
jgi:hypothetical protein